MRMELLRASSATYFFKPENYYFRNIATFRTALHKISAVQLLFSLYKGVEFELCRCSWLTLFVTKLSSTLEMKSPNCEFKFHRKPQYSRIVSSRSNCFMGTRTSYTFHAWKKRTCVCTLVEKASHVDVITAKTVIFSMIFTIHMYSAHAWYVLQEFSLGGIIGEHRHTERSKRISEHTSKSFHSILQSQLKRNPCISDPLSSEQVLLEVTIQHKVKQT